MKHDLLPVADLPGPAEVEQVEEALVKGGTATFVCYLAEPGQPEAEAFLWKLLVPRKF